MCTGPLRRLAGLDLPFAALPPRPPRAALEGVVLAVPAEAPPAPRVAPLLLGDDRPAPPLERLPFFPALPAPLALKSSSPAVVMPPSVAVPAAMLVSTSVTDPPSVVTAPMPPSASDEEAL